MHYYILLYMIKSHELLWAVKCDKHYYDLIDRIHNIKELKHIKQYTSDIDEYYIVKQNDCTNEEIENILYLKQFTLFEPNFNTEFLFETK